MITAMKPENLYQMLFVFGVVRCAVTAITWFLLLETSMSMILRCLLCAGFVDGEER
jgi:hypothetical protein